MRWAAGLIALCVAARVLTWDPIAHGDRERHVKVTLLVAAAAAVVALGAAARERRGPLTPLLWTGAVLLAADVSHYARVAHPITRGGPVVVAIGDVRDEVSLRRAWDLEQSDGGRIEISAGQVTLESPSGGAAYLVARVEAPPDPLRNWLLPVGLLERERIERVAWRASVHRTGPFYVVAELRRLLLQATTSGLHITYPDERDQLRGHELAHPASQDGRLHDWLVERTPGRVALTIDGQAVWSATAREPITQARLGDSKTDRSHAGSMRLERAIYAVHLDRT